MSDRTTADAIQKDWREREMIEVVHLNILKVRYFIISPHVLQKHVSLEVRVKRPKPGQNLYLNLVQDPLACIRLANIRC